MRGYAHGEAIESKSRSLLRNDTLRKDPDL
jgi:hypothetical protein